MSRLHRWDFISISFCSKSTQISNWNCVLPFYLQNVFDADSGSADVIVVDGDSRYEITIEDNDDDHEADDNVGTTNESLTVGVTDAAPPSAASVNNTSPDSIEDDSDRTFSNLIVDELRKMTPAAQKEFKRNVTQFLYSWNILSDETEIHLHHCQL